MPQTPVSPIRANKPQLTVWSAAINDEPVELDGTPTSPAESQARTVERLQAVEASRGLSAEDKKHLAELISTRQTDPAVLVDLPQTPQADELAIANAADKDKTSK